ncbi:MAG TPA: efflux RND transporter periplasmic adaptor subunit [Pirellulales bacterium]|nr:efflux RND transporter periplasmic adaptor subunit [Pirellulales bacterium]
MFARIARFRRYSAILLISVATGGCGQQPLEVEAPAALPRAQVVADKPQRKTLKLTTTQPAHIQAFEHTPLFAKITGYVETVLVDIGDVVKKDQTLVKLAVPEMLDDVAQKEALLAQSVAEERQAESIIQAAEAAAATAHAKIAEVDAGTARAAAELERWISEHARIKQLTTAGSVTKKLEDETLSQLRSAEATTREVAAQATSAKAAFSEAQANVHKAKADRAAATARVQVAKADLARAKTMLRYLEIKAPYDGTITRRGVDTGHYVDAGAGGPSQPLMEIDRTDVVRIFVDVPELQAAHVNAGDRSSVRVQALEKELEAKVVRMSWSLTETNHSLRAEIDIENSEGTLRPGMYAVATIMLDERSDVLTLPATAIVRDVAQTYCLCVVSERIEQRPIELGLRVGAEVEITSGLDGTEQVVIKPSAGLQPGQQVVVAAPAK